MKSSTEPENANFFGYKHKIRYFQFSLMFLTLVISFIIRTSLSVAILPMTLNSTSNVPTYPEWQNVDITLSSFFWGYVIPQIAAGQLVEHFGARWFLFTTLLICGIFQIAIPPMASSLGSLGVIICRVAQGLSQGFLYPSVHNLISQWAPFAERARVANFVYSGASLGIAISMPLTGALSESSFGWPLVFYGMGGFEVVWAFVLVWFMVNAPSKHSKISQEEKNYIEETNAIKHDNDAVKLPTPWKEMVTSLPLWAIFVAGCAQCWGGFTMVSQIPSYMSNVMKFDISSDSQLSALPYLVNAVLGLTASPLVDLLVKRKIVSITTSRKIFNGLATFVPALALTWLGFIDSSQKTLAIFLLVVAVGFCSFVLSGYLVNIIDLAPNHTGTITGIVNGCTNIFSIFGPITVGWLGSDKTDPILWRKVFLLAAGIYGSCGVFYVAFSSAKLQTWNDLEGAKSLSSNNINAKFKEKN